MSGGDATVLDAYTGRFGLYACTTVVASAFGSTFTWRATSDWIDANPFVSGPMAAVSLLPALAILAAVDVEWLSAFGIAGAAAIAIVVFWWTFATSESSTAVFVFSLGWLAGIPLALGVRKLLTSPRHR